jgi:hypothetical protein
MTKILFLDIDGPMIPGRAYKLPNQTKPFVMTFDPVAVSIINNVCQQEGYQIILHSSWVRIYGGQETYDHCITQGLKPESFHEDKWTGENENWRYNRVAHWLADHPEVTDYIILDDEPYEPDRSLDPINHPKDMEDHLMLIDFDDGLLMTHWRRMLNNEFVRATRVMDPETGLSEDTFQ